MIVNAILAALGLIVLTVAADQLVLGSSRLAARLHISPVVVGVVVIGLGTSAPEFLVSGMAAASGDTGIAIGNLIGSNILNLTLILGVAALVAPVAVHSRVVRREVPLAVAAVALFALLALAVARRVTSWISFLGARLGWREQAAAAWFGPKGFASVVYGLMVLTSDIVAAHLVFDLVALTIVVSIVLHSSTGILVARTFDESRLPGWRQRLGDRGRRLFGSPSDSAAG